MTDSFGSLEGIRPEMITGIVVAGLSIDDRQAVPSDGHGCQAVDDLELDDRG